MACYFALLGWSLVGPVGMALALLVGLLLTAHPAVSPLLVLRVNRAQPLAPSQELALRETLEHLSARAGLGRAPLLVRLPRRGCNAFALGDRRASVIALTDAMLGELSRRELFAVLAHEISHIAQGDVVPIAAARLFGKIAQSFTLLGLALVPVGVGLSLALAIRIDPLPVAALLLAWPFAGGVRQLLARSLEFEADLYAAGLTGDPAALGSALLTIERSRGRLARARRHWRPDATADDHPATRERVRRLLALPLGDTLAATPHN